MGIENLLAQGVQIRPAGMERNALMQAQEFKDRQQRNALMQMQMEDVHAQRQLAIEQARQVAADRARSEKFRQSITSPQMQASQQALAGGGGPTVGNAAQMRPVDPRLQMLHGAMQAGMGTPLDYINAANPQNKIKDYKAVRAADGSVSYVGLTDDGRVVQTGQQPFEKPEVKSFGNFMGGIDPITGKVTQYGAIGQSADNAASNARMAADSAAGRAQSDRHFNTTQGNANAPTWDASNQVWVDRKNQTVTPGVGPDGKPLQGKGGGTVDERNAAGYSSRMAEATKLLDQYESDGRSTYKTNAAGGIPFVGAASRTAVMDSKQQMYRQAQEDWVRAKLRKESGAAIGADEMDREILAYFPQPGELTGVVEQKRRARLIANEAMARSSGKAAYTSEVPAPVAPTFNTPTDPSAGAMDLLRRADAIVGR
jgi:hypothetical protein